MLIAHASLQTRTPTSVLVWWWPPHRRRPRLLFSPEDCRSGRLHPVGAVVVGPTTERLRVATSTEAGVTERIERWGGLLRRQLLDVLLGEEGVEELLDDELVFVGKVLDLLELS